MRLVSVTYSGDMIEVTPLHVGKAVKWRSLHTKDWCYGVVRCFESDTRGIALVDCPGVDGRSGASHIPITRSRLFPTKPPPTKDAKGGGNQPTSSATLIAEVA